MEWTTDLAVAVVNLTKRDFILAYVKEDIKKQKEIVDEIRSPWFISTWLTVSVDVETIIENWTELADSLVDKYEENPKRFKIWLSENLGL